MKLKSSNSKNWVSGAIDANGNTVFVNSKPDYINPNWYLFSPDGKLLYTSEEDFKNNKPSFFLDPVSGNFVSVDTVPKRNWTAL